MAVRASGEKTSTASSYPLILLLLDYFAILQDSRERDPRGSLHFYTSALFHFLFLFFFLFLKAFVEIFFLLSLLCLDFCSQRVTEKIEWIAARLMRRLDKPPRIILSRKANYFSNEPPGLQIRGMPERTIG